MQQQAKNTRRTGTVEYVYEKPDNDLVDLMKTSGREENVANVNFCEWREWCKDNSYKSATFAKHYLGVNPDKIDVNNDNSVSFLLTEVLRDLIVNNLIANTYYYKYGNNIQPLIINDLNPDDFEIIAKKNDFVVLENRYYLQECYRNSYSLRKISTNEELSFSHHFPSRNLIKNNAKLLVNPTTLHYNANREGPLSIINGLLQSATTGKTKYVETK